MAAFNEALKEKTQSRYPLDWATTQYNLGSTLSDLARDESGTASLEKAIAAYREALKELTQQRAGLYWARAHTNLGNALFRRGKAINTTGPLEEAAAAYSEATKEWTRETSRLDWAFEQSNIGDALFEVAKRESATTNLEAAVAAYRASLDIRANRIAQDPVTWAQTQRDWCFALWTLGQRARDEQEKGTAFLECRTGRQVLDAVIKYKDRLPPDYVLRAANAISAFSYYLVLMRDYQGALEAADSAWPRPRISTGSIPTRRTLLCFWDEPTRRGNSISREKAKQLTIRGSSRLWRISPSCEAPASMRP